MSAPATGNSPKAASQNATPPQPQSGDWRQSKWLAIGELIVVGLIFVADARHLIPFSKTPFLLAFGWISLWVR